MAQPIVGLSAEVTQPGIKSSKKESDRRNKSRSKKEKIKWGTATVTIEGNKAIVREGEIVKYVDAPKELKTAIVLDFDESVRFPNDASWLFEGATYITEINGLEKNDTSNVTTMAYMFGYMTKVRNLNLSNFNTSNVEVLEKMFYRCENLTELDLSSFDTKKNITLNNTFYGCEKLKFLNIENFDTVNTKFFLGCLEVMIRLSFHRC